MIRKNKVGYFRKGNTNKDMQINTYPFHYIWKDYTRRHGVDCDVALVLKDLHMAVISIRRVNIIGGFYNLLCFMNG